MNDERISRALQSLTRETAAPGFTARVLARVEERSRPAWRPRLPVAAAVAAAAVLALIFGVREWSYQQERHETLAKIDSLLVEKQELENEVRSLRRLAADARPVVYLGGNEQVDLVLDLARLYRRGGTGAAAGDRRDVRPAVMPGRHAGNDRTVY